MRNINIDHGDGWYGLAAAIIQQAAYDWLVTKLWLARHPFTDKMPAWSRKEWYHRNKDINQIERFFRSDYYTILCDIPGDKILFQLSKMLIEELTQCEQKSIYERSDGWRFGFDRKKKRLN